MSLENIFDVMEPGPLLQPVEAPKLNEESVPGSANTSSTTETTETPDLAQALPTQATIDESSATVEPESSPTADANVNYLSLIFRDGLDMPIPGLELTVTLPSGQVCTAVSTVQGAITVAVPAQASGQATVKVKDATGKHQPVCDVDLAKCKSAAIIRSPKVKADLSLRPHQQALTPLPASKDGAAKSIAPVQAKDRASSPVSKPTAAISKPNPAKTAALVATHPAKVDTSTAWWSSNGAIRHAWTWLSGGLHVSKKAPDMVPKNAEVVKTLNTAGQPVTVVVGSECPNPKKLRLGRNNVYRDAILEAAKRLGLVPQALCALMDCESGKVTEIV